MSTSTGRFLIRAVGLVLVVGAVAAVGLYRKTDWGVGVVPCLLWSMVWAVVMGVIGFRSMGRAFQVPPKEMIKVVFAGLLVRVFVLAASQAAVYVVIDAQWGARALLATTLFYLVVLGAEAYSLVLEMRHGTLRPAEALRPGGTSPDAPPQPGASGEADLER